MKSPINRGRLPRRLLLVALLPVLVIGLLPPAAQAQYFGRNKVQYDNFDFKIVPTTHFDIHFYPEEADAVEDAARMGERWYERLARTFQHEFAQKKPIILYADHPDFQQTNTLSGTLSEGVGGVTESLKNRVIMPLAGSYWDTDHVLGHELVHAFQYNIAQSRQGGGLQSLGRLPLWMIEGMAEYLSIGREDPLTAMWLRDALRRDDIPDIETLSKDSKYFPYRFGQAFWAYVGGTYGDDAVVDLFRRSLRVGIVPGIQQVLGVPHDTLSMQWHEEIAEAYGPLLEGRVPPEQSGTEILSPNTGAGRQNVAPSVSPDGRYVAFLSEKDLFSVDLFLADAQTGEVIRKLSSAASDPHADAIRFIDSSGDWSPDGSQFAFVVFADGDNEIVIVNSENGDRERQVAVDGVGALSNPAWSPDGNSIVFSGQQGGVTDLYLLDLATNDVRQLTNDRYADSQPTWSPDGRTIAFVSDRSAKTDFRALIYGKPQIALYEMDTGLVRALDLFGEVKHINPQYAPDGRSLYFISDWDGFSDIYRYTFASDEVRRVTNIATGVSGITWMSPAMSVASEAGTVVFSLFDTREFHIYALDQQQAETVIARADAIPAPGRLLPPVDSDRASRVASYLADAETGLLPEGTYSAEDAVDYDSSLQLDYIGQPSIGVASDRFGNYIGGGAAAFFSDMLGNKQMGVQVSAQGTVKDIGGQLFYQDLGSRWNWGLGGGRIPYQLLSGGFRGREDGLTELVFQRLRIFQDSFNGMLAYPFSTTRRIEGGLGFNRLSYDLEEEIQVLDPFTGRVLEVDRVTRNDLVPEPLNLFQSSMAFVTDYSFFGFTSPVRGGRSRFELGATTGTLNFLTLTADWRRYFNPTRNLTIGMRALHYGNYGREIDNSNLRRIPLGFETFIRGYAQESFDFATECSGGGFANCPEYERTQGHRIGVANIEVRVPFLGTEQFGVINFPYLPTELVAFADVGAAWDGNNSVDLRFDRNTTDRVPLFSAGFSARTNILGFLILESYYAYPFQRPDKGWHWGFSIAPGW